VLYDLSGLYVRAGQRPAAEGLLRQVLKLEPSHAGASNDLGYFWAEAGTNLAEAESLTRAAVAAEPASPTMLDSLGWVLYKRGRFAEAREVYDRALAATATPDAKDDAVAAEQPDPVMLDHVGDVCYRLNDKEAAARSWDRSRQRLTEMGDEATQREDLKPLKLQLQQKQRQLQAGQPVTVAPVVETPTTAASRPAQAGAQRGTGEAR
jgi:tetratricopeptide (TPR) repeat protein